MSVILSELEHARSQSCYRFQPTNQSTKNYITELSHHRKDTEQREDGGKEGRKKKY